jgi:redox-sensitive bicupin YhaK (pirin superfamily)
MTKTRKISKVLKNKPTIEGAGVHLKRVFGFSEVPLFDPFLLLDDFRSDNPTHFLKVFPLASSSWDRNHYLCSKRRCRTW